MCTCLFTRGVGASAQGSGKVKTKTIQKPASNSVSSGIRSLDDLKKVSKLLI